ncbi:hypothetical protein [Listeria costaricensis]|uniref:hypothetical protein n=1 Tax=Listeria costaricensis TaxID=2026604 RepID=UPI000C07F63C|nr:hypothetical protein [Listeria costaricensis]
MRDIEELSIIYDLFISELKFFSSAFDTQYENLKHTAMADELASDFSEVETDRAEILYQNDWITENHFALVKTINKTLDEMNNNNLLWSEEAVKHAKEWEECRQLGKELLKDLGY